MIIRKCRTDILRCQPGIFYLFINLLCIIRYRISSKGGSGCLLLLTLDRPATLGGRLVSGVHIIDKKASYYSVSWLIALSIWMAADFWLGVRQIQQSNSSFMSGVSSTISVSAKNCDIVMPNPLHIVSRVATEGTVFLLKMLPIVDCAKPHSFESLYSVQPRSRNNCWRRACVSIASPPFSYLFYFQVEQ